MTSEEIAALSKKHTISEWAVQGAVDPLPIDRAEGIYLYTPDGKRYIDFNSQLMSVNIGHSDPRVIKAIQAAGREAVLRDARRHDDRASREAGREACGDHPGRYRRLLLHQRRRGRPTRTRSRSRVPTPGATRFCRDTGRITGRPPQRWRPPASRAAGAQPPLPGMVHFTDWYHGVDREQDSADDRGAESRRS